jgi:hypothetical protein
VEVKTYSVAVIVINYGVPDVERGALVSDDSVGIPANQIRKIAYYWQAWRRPEA